MQMLADMMLVMAHPLKKFKTGHPHNDATWLPHSLTFVGKDFSNDALRNITFCI